MRHMWLFFLLSLPSATYAEIPDWLANALKANDPNQLEYFVDFDSDCPTEEPAAKEVVEGVIIRSRIKPVFGINAVNPFYLYAAISCLKDTNAFSINIYFGAFTPIPILYDYPFNRIGTFGSRDGAYLLDSLKRGIEDAMTAFVEANFLQ